MTLTTTEAAARLDCSKAWVCHLIATGQLKAARHGVAWVIDSREVAKFKPRKAGRPAAVREKLERKSKP